MREIGQIVPIDTSKAENEKTSATSGKWPLRWHLTSLVLPQLASVKRLAPLSGRFISVVVAQLASVKRISPLSEHLISVACFKGFPSSRVKTLNLTDGRVTQDFKWEKNKSTQKREWCSVVFRSRWDFFSAAWQIYLHQTKSKWVWP